MSKRNHGTPEKRPEFSPFLRGIGIKKTSESTLRFLACLQCQIERNGVATVAEMREVECLPQGTATGRAIFFEEKGVISRHPSQPNNTVGRPANEIQFVVEVPEQITEALRKYRTCEQLNDNPAT